VVNERDEEIGAERRDEIHRRGLLHRAVHVIVTGPGGGILLQQRSALKLRRSGAGGAGGTGLPGLRFSSPGQAWALRRDGLGVH
jgi:hypothetical protein